MEERGEHEHEWLTYSRFEPLDERNGGRAMEFHGEVNFGRNSNRRPRNSGIPGEVGVVAVVGEVEEGAREVVELWVRWI